ncbi:MAG: Na+/H+ antiporter subunit E [Ketobacteraceae bacterium]|nr:Na+/H+ antiporter subunit E [Ketobacteraceae bacterium]
MQRESRSFLLVTGVTLIPSLGLWFLLTGVDLQSLVVGIPFALLASAACGWLLDPDSLRVHWPSAFRFLVYFIGQSLLGTYRVGLMALQQDAGTRTGVLYRYHTQLQNRSARVLFVNAVSLLPGTLVVDIAADHLLIHSIDTRDTGQAGIRDCEALVARVFRLPFDPSPDPSLP